MSTMAYISLPREVAELPLLYIKPEGEDEFTVNKDAVESLGDILISGKDISYAIFVDKKGAIFNNCFKNPFIYELGTHIPDYYRKQRMEIIERYTEKEGVAVCLDNESMNQELSKYLDLSWTLYNQALYKVLHDIMKVGEFVEIYDSWIEEEDENHMYFSPPTFETVINLEELPTLPRSTETLKFGERKKLTIHKIGEGKRRTKD